jgi:hypothetical protein
LVPMTEYTSYRSERHTHPFVSSCLRWTQSQKYGSFPVIILIVVPFFSKGGRPKACPKYLLGIERCESSRTTRPFLQVQRALHLQCEETSDRGLSPRPWWCEHDYLQHRGFANTVIDHNLPCRPPSAPSYILYHVQ